MKRPSLFVPILTLSLAASAAGADDASEILQVSGVQGGLVIHLDCGDGDLTAPLRASDRYVVQGLDTDPENVACARKNIQQLGKYGPVSVDSFDGQRLPYIDNLVSLVVAEELGDTPLPEVMRVLCPGGVLCQRQGGRWTRTVKPRPEEMDDWTHYLHSASGNAVSRDTAVAPPRRLQWVGSPRWTRHHDHMSSFNAMVSAGGRVFYILDEGSRSSVQLPPVWSLIARDAFNGTVLWKRPLDPWQTQLWLLKSGPALLPRRLVAVDDTVYVTLGLNAELTALNAATGQTRHAFPATEGTEEILHIDGMLLVLVRKKPTATPWATRSHYQTVNEVRSEAEQWAWDATPQRLMAFDAASRKLQWQKDVAAAPMTLAADAKHMVFHSGKGLVCCDRLRGETLWTSEPVARAEPIRSWFAPTLVIHNDVVLFAGGENIRRHQGGRDSMTALDLATGKKLWTAPHPPSGYDSPEDILVIDDLVWTAPLTNTRDSGEFTGRNLRTGEVERRFPADDGRHMPHHRCHRAKATVNYILASRTGIEYVDLKAEHWNRNDWVRGACLYGIMPANGLTYAPPHSCACYIVAKLNGLCALAGGKGEPAASGGPRLHEGPAFGRPIDETAKAADSSAWPTYRSDALRSGKAGAAVGESLKPAWETPVGGKLSAMTAANGRVFVADVNAHTVHALDAETGKPLWSFTAGGRVDSPPTIWRGRVFFGSADGCVYCLAASDGLLVWRFCAAPTDQRMMAWEQLESVWPVGGSALLLDDPGGENATVYCVAGRSMFLDGGLRMLRLDAATGRRMSETVMDNRHPETGKPIDANIRWPNLPVALPDILSSDGRYVYMRSQRFDLEGQRVDVAPPTDVSRQRGQGVHLFCPTGFLDDSWWHRTYWVWGSTPGSGAGGWFAAAYFAPAGRILAIDKDEVYGFGHKPQYFPQTTSLEYHAFRMGKQAEFEATGPAKKSWLPSPRRPVYDWSCEAPLLGRALVLAGETLFVAGPPDLADTEKTQRSLHDPATQAVLAKQAEAMLGKRGGKLLAISTADGAVEATYDLRSPPVFDGMIAAAGRLLLATMDGKVVCLKGD